MVAGYGVSYLYKRLDDQYHFDKKFRYATADVPILGDFNRAIDNWNWANDYMKNRNISWDDVKYPTKINGSGSGFYSAFQPTVQSVERLYRDEDKRIERIKNEYSRNLRNEHYRTAIDANNIRRAWYYARM